MLLNIIDTDSCNNKSYTVITGQYEYIVGVHPSKIIRTDELAEKLSEDARKIVVLDDFAGSGDSLSNNYYAIVQQLERVKKNKVTDIFLAPIMATPGAYKRLNNISLGTYRCTCIPAEIVKGLSELDYFASLSPEQRAVFKEILEGGGYEGGSVNIAFPYMAPDNNSSFFSNNVASLFTLNGSGVKRKKKS